MLTTYESVYEFSLDAAKSYEYSQWGREVGGTTYNELVAMCATGDTSLGARAEAILDNINTVIATPEHRAWSPSPFGAYPMVPEAIAGLPDPMRYRRVVHNESTPVNMYVSVSLSAGVMEVQALNRGMAMLALCMKLQQVRPCQLYIIEESNRTNSPYDGDHIQVIRIESQPLNVSVAAFALCNANFARCLMYGNASRLGGACEWPANHCTPAYERRLRSMLGCESQDLLFPAASLYDPESTFMLANPVAWVNARIESFNAAIGEN